MFSHPFSYSRRGSNTSRGPSMRPSRGAPTLSVLCHGGKKVSGGTPTRAAELNTHEKELDWPHAAQRKVSTAAARRAVSGSERERRLPGQMEKR